MNVFLANEMHSNTCVQRGGKAAFVCSITWADYYSRTTLAHLNLTLGQTISTPKPKMSQKQYFCGAYAGEYAGIGRLCWALTKERDKKRKKQRQAGRQTEKITQLQNKCLEKNHLRAGSLVFVCACVRFSSFFSLLFLFCYEKTISDKSTPGPWPFLEHTTLPAPYAMFHFLSALSVLFLCL